MAKKKKYNWNLEEDLPDIDDHSLVKLEIIENYIGIYLRYLSKGLFTNVKLTVVDGFSGGGLYKNNITGSPIRIKKAIETTTKIIAFEKEQSNCPPATFDIDFRFIEKNIFAHEHLKVILGDYGYLCNNTECILGEFSNNLDQLIIDIQKKNRNGRAIFILDQYGYSDAPIRDINKIFTTLNKAECILTFSIDSLIDYLSEHNAKLLENLGLSKRDCEQILDIREDTNFSRSKIQPILYKAIVDASGAPYYTPFFIKSDNTSRAYWLFHFSSHSTARDEMIKLHWKEQNTFQHFGRAGLQMLLGYDSKRQENLFEFNNFAKERSIDTLGIEIPKLIKQLKTTSFGTLKNIIVNETPASFDLIKESLSESINSGEIEFKSEDGKSKRRKYTTIHDKDIVRWTGQKQTTFLF